MLRWTARALLASVLFAVVTTVGAAEGIQSRALQFSKGASSATVRGTLEGRQTIDYRLRARAGQTMRVTLESSNPGLAFNVLPPGSNDVALPDAISQQMWTGALPSDGEYAVRIYLPRSAARRGERASYTLTVGIDGGATAAAGGDADARASGATQRASEGRFDARGQIPCALAKGQPMGQCNFGVARAGGGTATVVVTRPDGRSRTIFFTNGRATGADLSQADGSMEFRATKESDLFRIQAGDERYEIPEPVISGG